VFSAVAFVEPGTLATPPRPAITAAAAPEKISSGHLAKGCVGKNPSGTACANAWGNCTSQNTTCHTN
jgi:hypothetical protein